MARPRGQATVTAEKLLGDVTMLVFGRCSPKEANSKTLEKQVYQLFLMIDHH